MGNQASSSSSSTSRASKPRRVPFRKKFSRGVGALGLTKAELEKRCQPSGLYPSCKWDDKAIRKLIGDGKLAARMKGDEVREGKAVHECPICFLNYAQVNTSKCCQALICTECYLQVRPQKEKSSACPFCNHARLSVNVLIMDEAEIEAREHEEQKAIEAKIQADKMLIKHSMTDNTQDEDHSEMVDPPESASGFGSNLEKNERVQQLRARTSSAASDPNSIEGDGLMISAMAMTPEERRQLEDEMKAQQLHPLTLRVEQEEAERRLENDQAYSRTQSGRLQALRSRRELLRQTLSSNMASSNTSDWSRMMDSLPSDQNDLVVMEAAMMLSREETRDRVGRGSDRRNHLFGSYNSSSADDVFARAASRSGRFGSALSAASLMMSEEEQVRRAIEASLQDTVAAESSEDTGSSDANNEDSTQSDGSSPAAKQSPPSQEESDGESVDRT